MTLSGLADTLSANALRGVNIHKNGDGWMVSARTATGLRPVYGEDLEETVARAVALGPQHPPEEPTDEDFGDLI